MRTEDEITKAHDRLVGIVLGEIPDPFLGDPESHARMHCVADCLCWVLEHEHNRTFAEILEKIDTYLADKGLALTKMTSRRIQ